MNSVTPISVKRCVDVFMSRSSGARAKCTGSRICCATLCRARSKARHKCCVPTANPGGSATRVSCVFCPCIFEPGCHTRSVWILSRPFGQRGSWSCASCTRSLAAVTTRRTRSCWQSSTRLWKTLTMTAIQGAEASSWSCCAR